MSLTPVPTPSFRVALVYPTIKESVGGCTPPYALLGLATVLRDAGIAVRLFDIDAFRNDRAALVRAVAAYDPSLLGLPVFYNTYDDVAATLRDLRKAGVSCSVVLGGPEVTAPPRRSTPTSRMFLTSWAVRPSGPSAPWSNVCATGRTSMTSPVSAFKEAVHGSSTPSPDSPTWSWSPSRIAVCSVRPTRRAGTGVSASAARPISWFPRGLSFQLPLLLQGHDEGVLPPQRVRPRRDGPRPAPRHPEYHVPG